MKSFKIHHYLAKFMCADARARLFECPFILLPPISILIDSPIEIEATTKNQRKKCSKMSKIDIKIQLNFNRLNPSIVYELLLFACIYIEQYAFLYCTNNTVTCLLLYSMCAYWPWNFSFYSFVVLLSNKQLWAEPKLVSLANTHNFKHNHVDYNDHNRRDCTIGM